MLRSISNYNESLCSRLGYVIRTCVSVFFRKKALLLSISALFVSGSVNPIHAHQPVAFTHKVQPIELVERVVPEPIDLQSIRLEDELREQEGGPYRFAIPRTVLITPDVNGMWEEIDNETWLWRIHITSPRASSISLGFTHYLMPSGGKLFIYSVDGKEVLGPYTERDNALHEQLWTPLIHSDDVMVELTIPLAKVENLKLTLGVINHGYRRMLSLPPMTKGLGDSDWCERNVACPEGDGWRDQIRSVAHYHVTLADGTYSCTGTLINNTAQNDKPYFLTAFHCFDEYDNGVLENPTGAAASMVVYWNFQASTCSGNTGPENQNQTGAYFRAAYCRSDFTLVELDEMPSCEFYVYYAGWDRSSSAPTSGVAIHHPAGDLKKISVENHSLSRSPGLSSSPCPTPDLTHLKVPHWEIGTTEWGSSGCAFFNPSRRVVGQLSGGTATCDTGGYDKFGHFYISWTGGGTNSTRLRNWLDPLSTSITAISGKDPGFKDTFPVTTLNFLKWTDTIGTPTVDDLANNEPSPPYSLHLEYNDQVISRAIDLSGASSAQLKYYWQRYSTETGDDLYVDYWDGSNWQPLRIHLYNEGSTTDFTPEIKDLPVEALHTGFRLSFKASCGSTTDEWYVDDVSVKATEGDAYEPDNTAAQADDILPDSPQTHSIAPVGDVDYVRFSLDSESEVVIETSGLSGDTKMWLYDDQQNEIDYDDDGGSDLFSRIERTCGIDALSAGTYYVKIAEYGNDAKIDSYEIILTVTTCAGPCCPTTITSYPYAESFENSDAHEYHSTDVPKTIPDPGTTTSTLVIANSGTISDLNVKLNITHGWDEDLDVYLIAPDGTRVELFTDVGGSSDNFSDTILDDEAATAITSGSAPFTGSYYPEGSLSDLDGKSITGTWILEVTDDESLISGTLNSWSLIVETGGGGDWVNSTDDDIDWTLHSGSTPSTDTGPSSACEGSYYMYVEASGNVTQTAILKGPCFDLSSLSGPALTFCYHMYGANMWDLTLEVSDDNCASWIPVWSLSGNQGDSWYEAVINLSTYSGSTIKVRFVGVTGSSYTSDMAIDYITVNEYELDAPVLHAEPNITPGLRNTIWWDPVPDATWYYAQCANDANFANTVTGSGWISETNCTFTGLDLGQTYWYRVKATPQIKSWSQTSQAEFQTDTLIDTIATSGGDVVLTGGGSTIFQDDFEDGNYDGWINGTSSCIRQVTDETAAAGTTYSLTQIGSSNHREGVYYTLPSIMPDRLIFHVRTDSTDASGYVLLDGANSSECAVFFYSGYGQLRVSQDTSYGTERELLTWYKVEFVFHWLTKTFDFYVDDELVADSTPFRNSASYINTIHLYNFRNAQAWWDEIEFSSGSGGGYAVTGDITSTAIDLPADGNWSWDVVDFNATMPENTELTIDVLNGLDESVILADVNSVTDISWVEATELKLRANLSTDDPNNTPVLHDWSVSYVPCESDWSNVESSLQCDTLCDFDNNNEINFADFAILTGQWLQAAGSPSADIAPEVPDGFVDFLDLAVFVENWLLDLTCTVQN